MLLNLSNGNTEYTHHIRYLAATSSWTMSATGDGAKGKIPFQFTQVVIDLENLKTGWCRFPKDSSGQSGAPQWVMDESLTKAAPKPEGDDWKRGFKVNLFSKALFGDEPVREYATSGTGSVKSMENLYPQFVAEIGANAGKVPVVEYKGSVAAKIGKGNTTIPTLVISKWVPRPAELGTTYEKAAPVQAMAALVQSSVSEF